MAERLEVGRPWEVLREAPVEVAHLMLPIDHHGKAARVSAAAPAGPRGRIPPEERVLEGEEAVRFLGRVKHLVEDPATLLFDA